MYTFTEGLNIGWMVDAGAPGVDLRVRAGELVALCGPVGSGKSTLLAAAWGEALVLGGSVAATPSVAVVPQRPFIIAGSVAENILLGRAIDDDRLASVIDACALRARRYAPFVLGEGSPLL